MKLINKTLKANRSGATVKVLDESSNFVVVKYLTSFAGIFKYSREAISKHWTVCELD